MTPDFVTADKAQTRGVPPPDPIPRRDSDARSPDEVAAETGVCPHAGKRLFTPDAAKTPPP